MAEPKSLLFTPISIRGTTFRNRVVVAPMATYAATDGLVGDWHLVHLGGMARGGAGLVFLEATAISPEGRITYGDTGIWSDAHVPGLRRIADYLRGTGAKSAIQIAHGGRKASMQRPWHGNGPMGQADFARGETTWDVVGPTDEPAGEGWLTPHALSLADLERLRGCYRDAARRSLAAGFDVLEVHGAHGYLLHSFLSPLSNKRNDRYGGPSRANRMRFPLEIAEIARAEWPADRPLFFRISSVDGVNVGWGVEDSIVLAKELHARGVDVVDCSSGGMILPRDAQLVSRLPGFQVPFAEAIRKAGVPTMAVGLITEPAQAEAILREGKADLVAIAREALYNPHWPAHAALALGADPDWSLWPEAYGWWLKRRDRQQGTDRAA